MHILVMYSHVATRPLISVSLCRLISIREGLATRDYSSCFGRCSDNKRWEISVQVWLMAVWLLWRVATLLSLTLEDLVGFHSVMTFRLAWRSELLQKYEPSIETRVASSLRSSGISLQPNMTLYRFTISMLGFRHRHAVGKKNTNHVTVKRAGGLLPKPKAIFSTTNPENFACISFSYILYNENVTDQTLGFDSLLFSNHVGLVNTSTLPMCFWRGMETTGFDYHRGYSRTEVCSNHTEPERNHDPRKLLGIKNSRWVGAYHVFDCSIATCS